jgi:hypothetical protein
MTLEIKLKIIADFEAGKWDQYHIWAGNTACCTSLTDLDSFFKKMDDHSPELLYFGLFSKIITILSFLKM